MRLRCLLPFLSPPARRGYDRDKRIVDRDIFRHADAAHAFIVPVFRKHPG